MFVGQTVFQDLTTILHGLHSIIDEVIVEARVTVLVRIFWIVTTGGIRLGNIGDWQTVGHAEIVGIISSGIALDTRVVDQWRTPVVDEVPTPHTNVTSSHILPEQHLLQTVQFILLIGIENLLVVIPVSQFVTAGLFTNLQRLCKGIGSALTEICVIGGIARRLLIHHRTTGPKQVLTLIGQCHHLIYTYSVLA